MIKKLLRWIITKFYGEPVAPDVTEDDHTDVILNDHLCACDTIVDRVDQYLHLHGWVLPSNLNDVVEEVFPTLPPHISDKDTAENRAELADTIHACALFVLRAKRWMDTPDDA